MSEQQVLPPLEFSREEMFKDAEAKGINRAWVIDKANEQTIACRERQLSTALASLAQSEAERERLQGENIKLLNDASVWRNRAIGA